MFAYCANNPVANIDSGGKFFFTALGAVIGAGVSALGAWAKDGTAEEVAKAAKAGAVSGAIAGAGVDVGILLASGVGTAAGLVAAGLLGAAGGVVGVGMSTDWTADPLHYIAGGLVGGLTNLISFGLAGQFAKGPVLTVLKEIAKRGLKDFGTNVVEGIIVSEGAYWTTEALCQ